MLVAADEMMVLEDSTAESYCKGTKMKRPIKYTSFI